MVKYSELSAEKMMWKVHSFNARVYMLPPSDLKRTLNHIIMLEIVLYKIIECGIPATMFELGFFSISFTGLLRSL